MPSNEAPSLRGLRQFYLWREPVLTPPPLSPLLFLKVLLPPLILPLQLLLLIQLQLLLWLVQPPLLLLQSASLLKLSRWKRHHSLSLSLSFHLYPKPQQQPLHQPHKYILPFSFTFSPPTPIFFLSLNYLFFTPISLLSTPSHHPFIVSSNFVSHSSN